MKRRTSFRRALPVAVIISAVVSGLVLSLAFHPVNAGLISFFALVPLVATLYLRRHAKKTFFLGGYVFGLSFFLPHFWWMLHLLPASTITLPWLMVPALIVLAAYLAVYPALVFFLMRMIGGASARAIVFLGPALWALVELLRASGELGLTWGAIGHSLYDYPSLIQISSVFGMYGVGAFIVLINMLLVAALLARGQRRRLLLFLLAAVGVAACAGWGRARIASFDREPREREVRVAIAQPDVDLEMKWKPEFADSTFRLIERLCRVVAPQHPALIVFPETCAPAYVRFDEGARDLLSGLARELDMSIYIGFLDGHYDGPNNSLNVYNSSGVFEVDGDLVFYDKMHLLPFGEAIPFSRRFPALKRIDFGQANFQPGPRRKPLPSTAGALGPMICFESIFPYLARDQVRQGADLLVNITNDGWFGRSAGPYQHNAMAVFRAVENRRFLLRSSNTGVSMFVDPVGRIVTQLDLYEEGFLISDVRPIAETTMYTRFGDRPLSALSLLLIVVGALVGRRGRFRL